VATEPSRQRIRPSFKIPQQAVSLDVLARPAVSPDEVKPNVLTGINVFLARSISGFKPSVDPLR
jgi:hypothetical protein